MIVPYEHSGEEVLSIMPYGEDFCFLSGTTAIKKRNNGETIVCGFYDVNPKQFKGHFKNLLMFPMVLKMEVVAQLGVFWLRNQEKYKDYIPMFSDKYLGCDLGVVLPGDRLEVEFIVTEFDGKRSGKAKGRTLVNWEEKNNFEFSFTVTKFGVLERNIRQKHQC